MVVDSAFNTYGSGGTKQFMLATSSQLGARNLVFACAWLLTGAVYIIAAVIFSVLGKWKDLTRYRDEDEMKEYLMARLSWRKPSVL